MTNKKVLTIAATALMGVTLAAPVFAATPSDRGDLNGGSPLPQTGNTDVGISFGNSNPTGNTGLLKLYKVPSILDFGNHSKLTDAFPNFNATGKNVDATGNNQHASYDMSADNKTSVKANSDIVYAQVVDDQTTRQGTAYTAADPETADKYDSKAGLWTLTVQGNGKLTSKEGKELKGTKLFLKNSVLADQQDSIVATGVAGATAGTKPSTLNSNIIIDMDAAAAGVVNVETAKAQEGAGLTETQWKQSDVVLNVPGKENANVSDGVYMGQLTWTLKSDVAAVTTAVAPTVKPSTTK